MQKIASMATIPGREESFEEAALSIMPGLSEFCHYEGTDKYGDANKFKGVIGKEGYLFTCDDDLLFPDDYKQYMIQKIEQYDRKAVITCHGKIIRNHPIESFYGRDFIKFRCLDDVKRDVPVHIPGTGCMGWHSDTIQFAMDDFKAKNMADIWAGIKCETEDVPRVCVGHEKGWLKNINNNDSNCYQQNKDRDDLLTEAINSITWKTLLK